MNNLLSRPFVPRVSNDKSIPVMVSQNLILWNIAKGINFLAMLEFIKPFWSVILISFGLAKLLKGFESLRHLHPMLIIKVSKIPTNRIEWPVS